MMRRGRARTGAIVLASGLGIGCVESGPVAPPSPTPTPPPSISAGAPAERLAAEGPGARVRYHLVLRADAGVAFFPLSITALAGTGSIAWTRWTEATFAYDAVSDRFVPSPADAGGVPREELADVVFPGAAQEVAVEVRYAGEPPDMERFEARYRVLPIAELPHRVYVKAEKGRPGRNGERVEREPLGNRVRSVDVFRWVAGGAFLRDDRPAAGVTVTVPGPPGNATGEAP